MNNNIQADDFDYNVPPDGDHSYTWPVGSDDVVVQWDLMAKDGIITEEAAARMKAADKAAAISSLARRRPSRMSPVNRLQFMRTLSLHGLTQAELRVAGGAP